MENASTEYVEVYTILSLLSKEMKNKIPEDIFKRIEDKKNEQIEHINRENLENYKISDKANQLLASIYKNYFATEKEKEVIRAKENIVLNGKQTKLEEKYSVEDLWKNRNKVEDSINNTEIDKNKYDKRPANIVEYKESIIRRMINKIKRFFYNCD